MLKRKRADSIRAFSVALFLTLCVGCGSSRGDLSYRDNREYLKASPQKVEMEQANQSQTAGVQAGQVDFEKVEAALLRMENTLLAYSKQNQAGRDVTEFSWPMVVVIVILGLAPFGALLYGMHRSRKRADQRYQDMYEYIFKKGVPRE